MVIGNEKADELTDEGFRPLQCGRIHTVRVPTIWQ